ncbi:ferritin-like domain-containing protein [Longispora sp. NPDC051575]|uniref:ferritin-like domain-containing protein n=1 Tax=Longispora sp. NPDC051575 TaxID=3154943 RepID=UPI00343EC825
MNAATQLTAALAAEHAAVYGYGVLGSRLEGTALEAARSAEAAHRERRDALVVRLTAAGATPPPAEPVYAPPSPVTDRATALALAVGIEERAAQAWRAALPVTEGEERRLALDALVDTAQRAARWRRVGGVSPSVVAFPGRPA